MDNEERYGVGSASLDPMSSGLLINVIRTLTSSVSDDQRQLERLRLEKGHAHSGLVIDGLLKEHESDVEQCLISFRQVFNGITSCREHIHNVKNALLTCKSLLQCRRDDLKKLWLESAEQNYVSKILQEIYEIKHIDQVIEAHLDESHYRKAADVLKKADILLSGPLSQIAGLQELRVNVSVNNENLFEKIVQDLLHWIVVVPLDCQILELMKNLTESQINDSSVCMAIIGKYSSSLMYSLPPIYASMIGHWSSSTQTDTALSHNVVSTTDTSNSTAQLVKKKVVECLAALRVFDQLDSAMENILTRTSSCCFRAVSDSVAVLRLMIKDNMGDATHFYQLCQLLIRQFNECAFRFDILLEELQKINNVSKQPLLHRVWEILQDVLESVASEHLEIWRTTDGDKSVEDRKRRTKTLFSFNNTSFVATANSSLHKKQSNLICSASPYNISSVFHILNRFSKQVEEMFENKICKFDTYLHTFVMEEFIERLRADLEAKTEVILSGPDVWSSVSHITSYNTKILTSGIRIFELCEMINEFILKMGSYTQRFASLWLLIIASYTKSATDMYSQIIRTRSRQGESLIDYPKISAAWAVDEDISRLLKSLPSWTNISNLSSPTGSGEPSLLAGAIADGGKMGHGESEQDIRLRTQRESEILIGNLGTQKQIQRVELITDMEHAKSLVCMHESLHWFVCSMRKMIADMPEENREIIKCRVQISTDDNETMVEQLLSEALEERISKLENMAETCLLMLYLEIRVHCFYHLLPLARFRNSTVSQDEQDRELIEFGKDLILYNQTLSAYVGPWKLKYLFAGLGHLCASIFIHSSQYLSKMSESDQKRICRNIFTVQKCLSQLSGRPETEMNRAQTFFKLVNMEIDHIFALAKESGESYAYLELTYLLSLAVRSHAILSSQPGALEAILNRLRENMSKF